MKQKIWMVLPAVFLILVMGSAYTNCSNTRLAQVPPPLEKVDIESKIAGTICSQVSASSANPLNVIFILDMSGSNVRVYPGNPNPTDITGLRIKKIQDFITKCDPLKKDRYRIIPFSDQIMLNDPATNSRCTSFTSATEAASDLTALLTINNGDTSSMKTTNYEAALSCYNTLITAEMDFQKSTAPEILRNQFYVSFLVTDGAPTKSNGAPIDPTAQVIEDYASVVRTTTLELRQVAGGSIFQPVYYGSLDFSIANQFLQPMAVAGGTKETLKITDLSNGSLDFCKLASTPLLMPYSIGNPLVINLNAIMYMGALKPDSDGDGVADPIDLELAIRRRASNKSILDGICLYQLPGLCPTLNLGNCDPNKFDYFGLSECDRIAMSLSTAGGDEDIDGMPDAIEILRHAIPSDPDWYRDDGDGIPRIDKLRRGLEIGVLQKNVPPQYEMKAVFQNRVPQTVCSSGAQEFSFEVQNNPLVHTLRYHSSFPEEEKIFGHEADENLEMIYYFSQPSDAALLDTEVYVTKPEIIRSKLKFTYGKGKSVTIQPQDFVLAGRFRKLGSP